MGIGFAKAGEEAQGPEARHGLYVAQHRQKQKPVDDGAGPPCADEPQRRKTQLAEHQHVVSSNVERNAREDDERHRPGPRHGLDEAPQRHKPEHRQKTPYDGSQVLLADEDRLFVLAHQPPERRGVPYDQDRRDRQRYAQP